MAEYTKEDIEVARQILDFQRLLITDMKVAFPLGIRQYHLSAMAGAFLEMFIQLSPDPEQRRRIWETICIGMEERFKDGRL